MESVYIAIDLKSFYASVECVERELNPLTTNLVVADNSRTEKTICLAVSPSLKAHGIPGRARLFEVVQRVKEVNAFRANSVPGGRFTGSSYHSEELEKNRDLKLDYIVATPRMALYMKYSAEIYEIYLKYVAPEDIHVYSIDEVFIDVTHYLKANDLTPHEMAMKMIQDVLSNTGITATAGIGTNLYLSKVAMDIVAKHIKPDKEGVRIAELDEKKYRSLLWNHRPLQDFWRVGRGYVKKLEGKGLYTMGDIARCSLGGKSDYYNEDLLYKMFGVNAELLIDHAWGFEPCTMADIKAYKPQVNSLGTGQVLQSPYTFTKARIVTREMVDSIVLDLVEKNLLTNQIVLTVGYDIDNLKNPLISASYKGAVTTDHYGRRVPKHAHGTTNLLKHTSSTKLITEAVMELYDKIVDENLLVRRVNISVNNVIAEGCLQENLSRNGEQLNLFEQISPAEEASCEEELEQEKKMQKAILDIKKKFGKGVILKGTSFEEGATARERNKQIGGHKA